MWQRRVASSTHCLCRSVVDQQLPSAHTWLPLSILVSIIQLHVYKIIAFQPAFPYLYSCQQCVPLLYTLNSELLPFAQHLSNSKWRDMFNSTFHVGSPHFALLILNVLYLQQSQKVQLVLRHHPWLILFPGTLSGCWITEPEMVQPKVRINISGKCCLYEWNIYQANLTIAPTMYVFPYSLCSNSELSCP